MSVRSGGENAGGGSIVIRVDVPDSDSLREYGITQMAESIVYECSGIDFTCGWSVVEATGPDEATVCHRCGCAYHGFVDPCEDCNHRLCATANPDGPTLRWAPTVKPTITTADASGPQVQSERASNE